MHNQKFIIVQDVETAQKLIVNGFQFVSKLNGMYTFMNVIPLHFDFSKVDIKKLVYTDTLVF